MGHMLVDLYFCLLLLPVCPALFVGGQYVEVEVRSGPCRPVKAAGAPDLLSACLVFIWQSKIDPLRLQLIPQQTSQTGHQFDIETGTTIAREKLMCLMDAESKLYKTKS